MNTAVTIGNATPESFRQWFDKQGTTGLMASIFPSIGYWQGQSEDSVLVVLWDTSPTLARQLLRAYGEDHPAEEAFGLFPWPESQLVTNPAARKVA